MKLQHLCLAAFILVISTPSVSMDERVNNTVGKNNVLSGPRPIGHHFPNVQWDLTKTCLNVKIDVFKSYGCEHMVVLTNEVTSPVLLWCSCGHEGIEEIQVNPEESFAFTFAPKRNGNSVIQCVLNYEENWTTFAAYDEEELHSAPRDNSYVYAYSVQQDGVYINQKHKIQSFLRFFDYSADDYLDDYAHPTPKARLDHSSTTEADQPKRYKLKELPMVFLDLFNKIPKQLSEKDGCVPVSTQIVDDRFNILRADLSKEDLRTEIDDFGNYDCERMVVLSNDATDSFRLYCSSGEKPVMRYAMSVGESVTLSFKPKHNGNSRLACAFRYRGKFTALNVFNGTESSCTCKQQNRYVFQYSIRHYGVYSEDNTKIMSLFNGRNQYTLWESYNDNMTLPFGKLMTEYVDGPEDCTTVPSEMNDRASAITVCDHQCVEAWEHIKCEGRRQVIQAHSGCMHVKLTNGLHKELSSVRGC